MKKDLSVQNQLLKIIEEKGVGNLFFPADYYDIGSPQAVNAAFSRLAAKGTLERMGKGIYLYPEFHHGFGFYLHPSRGDIAEIIAKRENIIIRHTGEYALNKLGLSTQVVTKAVYLTNGNSREFKVGKGTIEFIRVSPKKLAAKGPLSYLAIQALESLGERETDENTLNRLYEVLRHEDLDILKEDIKLTSGWIKKILITITKKIESHG
jgi:hypothetical protein